MKNLSLLILPLTMAGVLLAGTAAKADPLSLTITSAYQDSDPGALLTFDATVTNTDSTEVVYLNSDDVTLGGPLSLDDSPFFSGFPFYLDPGDSYTGELFTVSIPVGAPAGLYAGSFEILGGDPSDFTDVVGSANFDVNVTPEPSSFLLLATGLAGLGVTLRRRLVG